MLQSNTGVINIDCCDPLGRSALLMAIDNENLEMLELLLEHKVGIFITKFRDLSRQRFYQLFNNSLLPLKLFTNVLVRTLFWIVI